MDEITLSYTFLSTYKKCPKRAYLQYVKRIIPPDKVNHRPFIVGIVADWLFRKWAEGGFVEGWMERKAEDIFYWFAARRNIIYRGAQDKEHLVRKLIDSVRHLETATYTEQLPDKKMELQKQVRFTYEGFNVFGKLDIWFPETGIIWDLKITTTTRYLDSFQLFFFAWLLTHENLNVNELAFFAPLMKPYVRSVDYNITGRQNFDLELARLISLLQSKFWLRSTDDCFGCPVSHACEEPIEATSFSRGKDGGFQFEV